MKDMIKRVREEKGGFTMAELLIVVAIVAVLVAIAIPVFSAQLANAQKSTDEANCRSYYATVVADYMQTQKLPDDMASVNKGNDLPSYGGTSAYKLQQGSLTIMKDAGKVTFTYCPEGADSTDTYYWSSSFNEITS